LLALQTMCGLIAAILFIILAPIYPNQGTCSLFGSIGFAACGLYGLLLGIGYCYQDERCLRIIQSVALSVQAHLLSENPYARVISRMGGQQIVAFVAVCPSLVVYSLIAGLPTIS
jgi:hypothetical protein